MLHKESVDYIFGLLIKPVLTIFNHFQFLFCSYFSIGGIENIS